MAKAKATAEEEAPSAEETRYVVDFDAVGIWYKGDVVEESLLGKNKDRWVELKAIHPETDEERQRRQGAPENTTGDMKNSETEFREENPQLVGEADTTTSTVDEDEPPKIEE